MFKKALLIAGFLAISSVAMADDHNGGSSSGHGGGRPAGNNQSHAAVGAGPTNRAVNGPSGAGARGPQFGAGFDHGDGGHRGGWHNGWRDDWYGGWGGGFYGNPYWYVPPVVIAPSPDFQSSCQWIQNYEQVGPNQYAYIQREICLQPDGTWAIVK